MSRISVAAAFLVLVISSGVGCDEPDEPEAPSIDVTPTPEVEPLAVEDEEEEEAPVAVDPPQAPERSALRRQARADARIVAQARARSAADEHGEALALLEPLIERTPFGPRLRCEAGYIAFRAERGARATELLTEGLSQHGPRERLRASMRVPLAMCLYNRGLVNEDEGRRAEAAADFHASLALRPNRIVQRHLDAVGEVQPVTAPRQEEAQFPGRAQGANVNAAQAEIAEAVCAAAIDQLEVGRPRVSRMTGCRAAHEELEVSGDAQEVRVELLTYTPTGVRSIGGSTPREESSEGFNAYYLAFVDANGAQVIGPASTTNIWDQYPAEPGFDARWIDIRPGGGPELVVDLGSRGSNSEDGCSGDWGVRELIVCAVAPQAGWLCGHVDLGYSNETQCYHDSYDEDDEEPEDYEDDGFTSDVSTWYAAEIEPDGEGGLRFSSGSETTTLTLTEMLSGDAEPGMSSSLGD